MNTTPESEFVELRRLLAIKRHEQPPPGYFARISVEVISELKAHRNRRHSAENYSDVPAWIIWTFERLQARPAFAGAFGILLCAGLVGGLFFMETDAAAPAPFPALLSEASPAMQPRTTSAETTEADSLFQPVGLDAAPMLADTNDRPSLFDIIPGLDTAPVADQRY